MVTVPVATLSSNGKSTIPLVGFGTAEFPFSSTESVKDIILHAIKLEYRHFDNAAIYQTEQSLGKAVAEALLLGLIKSRDELFITSKLWVANVHRDLVLPAIQTTLKNLELEYLDLYLIHFPVSLRPGVVYPWEKDDILPMDLDSVWQAMEECQKFGLTKSIGVSNFTCKKLEKLLATARIPPAVNQVEMNPLWQQKKLRKFCEEKGIHLTAYSPLGARGSPLWGTNCVMECEVLKDIANSIGKTVAQVSLRWVHEQGVSLVVKSFNEGRMEQNLDIFDWNLTKEELHKIEQIPQTRGNPAEYFVSETGPYKSIEEFWDGEI